MNVLATHVLARSLLCSLLTLLLPAQVAHAQSEQRVYLSYAASDDEALALADTLASALQLPGIITRLTRVPEVDARSIVRAPAADALALACIWVDLREARRASVYIVERSGKRVFVRSLERAPDNRQLDHAQVGEIVRGAVQALLQGAVIGIATPQPLAQAGELPAQPARADAEPTPRVTFGAGVLYAAGLQAQAADVTHGPGVYVFLLRAVAHPESLAWGGLASARYASHRMARADVSARLDTLMLRAGPACDVPWSARTGLRLSLGLGVDLVALAPDARGSAGRADSSRTLAFAMLQLGAALRHRPTRDIELSISLLLDVDAVDTRYVLQRGAQQVNVEDPWRVRPSLALGFGFF